MELVINGERRGVAAGLTVSALLQELGLEAGRVVVELNRDIVPREQYEATPLHDGDALELVELVGGG
ncbi:MAG: sulfur carrier protein ThiS [Candidatus Coatesbacteria bacterium]|nr:MAG: sulfur carrier protein ThiS [Candidatus Coatesbacteria bacterium]